MYDKEGIFPTMSNAVRRKSLADDNSSVNDKATYEYV